MARKSLPDGLGLARKRPKGFHSSISPAKTIDPRAGQIVDLATRATALEDHVQAVLGTAGVILGKKDLVDVADAVGATRSASKAILDRFLEIGRALILVQEKVGMGGYRALHEAGLVQIPETTASKLRVIAAAVDDGRLPLDRLPRTAEAAYAAARLSPPEAARLLDEEVIRPEASRRAILAAIRPPRPAVDKDAPLTKAERGRIERRLKRLREEMARLEARLARG